MQHCRITRLRPDTNGFASMSCATNGATPSPPTFDASDEDATPVSHAPAQWCKSSKAWSP
jgi:hypothetical protein